jgi:hypothetical protein
MDSIPVQNPYEVAPNSDKLAPFADRSTAMTRVRQQIADAGAPALALLGREGIGKTALLRQIDATTDETVLTIYVNLADTPLDSEGDWLLALAQSATEELVRHDFTLSRLASMQPPGNDVRSWLDNTFLSEFCSIIRPQRRAAFLLDNIEVLLDAIDRGGLPDSSMAYLQFLRHERPQITFVVTLDDRHESSLPRLQPLVDSGDVIRLTDLPLDAVGEILREPVARRYNVSDDAAIAVHRATGGYPPFVQAFGAALYRRQHNLSYQDEMTGEDVKAVTQDVYPKAAPTYAQNWAALPLNERLVLGSISTLTYEDPLRVIDAEAIEAWLVETDYPLDAMTINALLRSLEYRELIQATPTGGHVIHAAMMQRWLLENARFGEAGRAQSERSLPNLRWIAVAVVAIIIIGLAVMLSRTSAPENRPTGDAPPTVTLIGP